MKPLTLLSFRTSYMALMLYCESTLTIYIIMETKKTVQVSSEDAAVNVYVVAGYKFLKGEDYLRIFTDSFMTLAQDKDFTMRDIRVLCYILAYMQYENTFTASQLKIAKDLEIAQPDVSKSIKKLAEKQILRLLDKVGKQNVYLINPSFAFKGKAKRLSDLKTIYCADHIENNSIDN